LSQRLVVRIMYENEDVQSKICMDRSWVSATPWVLGRLLLNLPIQLTPVWCIALSYKKVMATTLLQILLLPVVLVTM